MFGQNGYQGVWNVVAMLYGCYGNKGSYYNTEHRTWLCESGEMTTMINYISALPCWPVLHSFGYLQNLFQQEVNFKKNDLKRVSYNMVCLQFHIVW